MKRAAVVAGVFLLAGTMMSGNASADAVGGEIGVQSCYGNAKNYNKNRGNPVFPELRRLYTTVNCADINLKPYNVGVHVRVCFERTGCQGTYKYAAPGRWTAIATRVHDGVPFYFHFRDAQVASTGEYAI